MSEVKVSIIMGSASDLGVMEGAAKFLEQMGISYEVAIISAHRAPDKLKSYLAGTDKRNTKVIIAGAGAAAHLPGVIAGYTILPVVGVPIKSSNSIDGWDSILSILQMPSGVPVATVALDASKNAAIIATQILATSDADLSKKLVQFKVDMRQAVLDSSQKAIDKGFPVADLS